MVGTEGPELVEVDEEMTVLLDDATVLLGDKSSVLLVEKVVAFGTEIDVAVELVDVNAPEEVCVFEVALDAGMLMALVDKLEMIEELDDTDDDDGDDEVPEEADKLEDCIVEEGWLVEETTELGDTVDDTVEEADVPIVEDIVTVDADAIEADDEAVKETDKLDEIEVDSDTVEEASELADDEVESVEADALVVKETEELIEAAAELVEEEMVELGEKRSDGEADEVNDRETEEELIKGVDELDDKEAEEVLVELVPDDTELVDCDAVAVAETPLVPEVAELVVESVAEEVVVVTIGALALDEVDAMLNDCVLLGTAVDMLAGTCVYKLSRLPLPQYSDLFPGQSILQSVSLALTLPGLVALPQ